MANVGPQCPSDQDDEAQLKSERRRRHKSSRRTAERESKGESGDMEGIESNQIEDEKERRRRKKERKEERERKLQQKLEIAKKQISLPFVITRMPAYTAQSSDSESSIHVERSIRRRQTVNQR